jgi:SAM-dependent methyltransferase
VDNPDRLKILQYHETRIRAHGLRSAMALGWNIPANQQVRFEMLAEIAALDNKSVLDVGCGRGDLRAYLGGKFASVQYTGIEHLEEFLVIAKKLYGRLPGTKFILADFWTTPIPPSDFILASGALNYANSDPDFIYKQISRLYAAAVEGFGFNLLSKVGYPPGDLRAHDPDDILSYCRTLSKRVRYRDGYLDGDYTIFMYH